MIEDGVSLIVSNNDKTIVDDFIAVFNDLITKNQSLVHTIYLVKSANAIFDNTVDYNNNGIYYYFDIEQIQVHIHNDVVVLYQYESYLRIELDNEIKFLNAYFLPNPYIFVDNIFNKVDYFTFIKHICNIDGNIFSTYLQSNETIYDNGIKLLDREDIIINNLYVEENDFYDLIEESVNMQIDAWEYEIESAITRDEPYAGIDENPFSDRFYDRDDTYNY